MNNPAWKMYVFRDGRYEIAGAELVSRLRGALCRARGAAEQESEDCLLAALIAAGELECALLDAMPDDSLLNLSWAIASLITDGLARAFLTGQRDSLSSIIHLTGRLRMGAHYEAAVQEGFAYYALHPRKLTMLLDSLPETGSGGRPIRVLGIRSIGVTLGAVACASLALRGIDCRRMSVRPTGHPYDRTLAVSPRLREWVTGAADAEFLVVDEGPGISGSSFLAVAEALEGCGIPGNRIHLIGSRQADPATLVALDAARRWRRYRFHAIPAEPLPPAEAGEGLAGSTWWQHYCPSREALGRWTPLEPATYLACDRESSFCFAGFGHYGEAVAARAQTLADAGFAPRYLGSRRGFLESALVPGEILSTAERSPELLSRMAAYLAFRAEAVPSAAEQAPELESMLRWNWQLEFSEKLGSSESRLRAERVVICDGRMSPHLWLRSRAGELLKLDAATYGDNHFFPGPCDIAWDVAGCIVEWELQVEARRRLIDEYASLSGDAVAGRLAPYLLAYTTFRMAYSRMAAAAMQGRAEEEALARDYRRYRAQALRLRLPHGLTAGAAEDSETSNEPLARSSLRAS